MLQLLAQFEPYEGVNYFWFVVCMAMIFIISWINTKPIEDYLSINETEEEPQGAVNFRYENTTAEPMTEDDWNIICRTAVEEAKAGSAAARTWVTKNIVENNATTPDASKPRRSKPKSKPESYNGTPSDIVNDAVSVLRQAGHTKADAVKKVRECIKEKTYDTLESLISDAFAK